MPFNDRSADLPGSVAEQATTLWRQQVETWPLLADGLAALRQAKTRHFQLDGSRVVVQCNPARVHSASAMVGPNHNPPQPCVLCPEHLPKAQRAIPYADRWLILCNPVPILEPHFTIPSLHHEPQRLDAALPAMLQLARDFNGAYTVFYNGPDCGASLPDHLHLQATKAGSLPFEQELAGQLQPTPPQHHGRPAINWLPDGSVRMGMTPPTLRPAVILVSKDQDALSHSLTHVVNTVNKIRPAEPEPRLNLFARYNDDAWLVWLFPRTAHRPSVYGPQPEAFLIRPGAIDLGGLLIVTMKIGA